MRDDERPLSEVMLALLRPGGLQELAEAALRRTLAADPHDTDARWKLAGIHRRQGDFAAARDLYRRLGARGPDRRKAAWLHAVLGGGGPPEAAPRGIWPAPFVWMTNFLAPGQCDRLLALALQGRERFVPAQVGPELSPRVDPEVRLTLEADSRTMQDFRPWFARKIRSLMPEVLARLRMEGIGRYQLELGMRGYHTGGGSTGRIATMAQPAMNHGSSASCISFTASPGASPAEICCSTIRTPIPASAPTVIFRGSSRSATASSSFPAPAGTRCIPCSARRTTSGTGGGS